MNRLGSFRHLVALCALLLLAGVGNRAILPAQESAAPVTGASVVKTHTYVSLDPVPRGKDFQIAVVVDINEGYHMNSHKPRDPYLIPTTVTPQLPAGFTLADTVYPNGQLKKFPFSPDKALDVYSSRVTFRLRLAAGATAPIGAAKIPITLRFQACNNSACLPPVKVALSVPLEVAGADAKTRALHPEIFSAARPEPK
ncbi:MAG: protein-disulfide reductase DsbD N-terminal domain-containing protein [Acidobacteriia bacterium]|nr:protein-disulfide reductase DsbD N-terminal domain-containing protein [Terriglobia bacterium]